MSIIILHLFPRNSIISASDKFPCRLLKWLSLLEEGDRLDKV